MASAATMAAAGFDKRASTASSSLQTPASGTFPSELRSPLVGSPGYVKKHDNDLKTPITPPASYLDYLRNMSPAMLSPAPTSTSARFSFNDSDRPSITPPTSQPALSRNTSYDSATSTSTDHSAASFSSTNSTSTAATTRNRPESPRVTIPPSPFAKPAPRSARTPRRLHIPQSPFSPSALGSAHSVPSPYASTPLSAAPWSATFSPSNNVDPEISGKPGRVSVRQVVTRTVTYCRTPLDPAPKGKRRKIEGDWPVPAAPVEELGSGESSMSESKESSAEPAAPAAAAAIVVKKEKHDEDEQSSKMAPEPAAVVAAKEDA